MTAQRVHEAVLDCVAHVLGLPDTRLIDCDRSLFETGLDSLTALTLQMELEVTFACSLHATIAFEHPTVRSLASFISHQLGGHPTKLVDAPAPTASLHSR